MLLPAALEAADFIRRPTPWRTHPHESAPRTHAYYSGTQIRHILRTQALKADGLLGAFTAMARRAIAEAPVREAGAFPFENGSISRP